jgi:hypothetical protein
MPVPAVGVGDIVQVTIETNTDATVNLNVLHYRCLTPPTDPAYLPALQELATSVAAVGTGILPAMAALMDDRMYISGVRCQRVRPQRDFFYRLATLQSGTIVGGAAPPNTALSITKKTEEVGKGFSGHFQLGGLSVTLFSDFGVFTAPAIALATELGNAIAAKRVKVGGGADVWQPCMLSVAQPGYHDIRVCSPRSQIRTMHRRTVGLGV